VSTNHLYISRDVIFQENSFPFLIPAPSITHGSNASILGPYPGLLQPMQALAHVNSSSPPIGSAKTSPAPSLVETQARNPPSSPLQPLNPNTQPGPSPTPDMTQISSSSSPDTATPESPLPTATILNLSISTHPMTTRSKNNITQPKIPTDGTVRYPLPKALLAASTVEPDLHEPTCFTLASKSPHWRRAMNLEFDALLKNSTWNLVLPLPNQNTIGCKWVFRIKRHADGTFERYKARLVAKGFHQQFGVNYEETYSPVIKPTTVCTVLSIAISAGWKIHHIDIQNAFLHGTLSEEVFMEQPSGFQHPQFPNHVCKLQKAIYGLKQAPRAWFSRLSSRLIALGFHGSKSDTSFICCTSAFTIYVLIYVGDIIITSSSAPAIDTLLFNLKIDFAVKHLGPLNFFLGIEVIPIADGILLSQQCYIKDILSRTKMIEAKPISTPVASSTNLSAYKGEPFSDHTLFRSTVGAL
jgi:hypothetical protein